MSYAPYCPYTLPFIQVRGAPFEIGRQYGELAREKIMLHAMNQKWAMARRKPEDPEWWRREIPKYLPIYEKLVPHMVEEMQGMARGARVDLDDVYLINFRDNIPAVLRKPEPPEEGCTSFGLSGEVTLSGEPMVGQTKDTEPISADLYVVLAMYQKGRPDILQMPYAGELAVFGFSTTGVSSFGNSMFLKGHKPSGLPSTVFRRLCLEANNIEEVIAIKEKYGAGGGGNQTVGDRTGRAVAIEGSAYGMVVLEQKNGIIVHANNALSHLKQYENWTPDEIHGSQNRVNRLTAFFEAERGRLTAPLVMRGLVDHDNYPLSLCRHSGPGENTMTTAALVCEPTLNRIHVIRGQPCQGWAATYSL